MSNTPDSSTPNISTDTVQTSITESRRHQIFPTLNEAQYELLKQYGDHVAFRKGEILYREGERHIPMYVILSGAVSIERNGLNGPYLMATHGPGVFTGEVSTLAGRAAIATARVVEDCEVIVINEASLRTLVISEAELSETIMRAFILRRVAFIEDQHGGVTVIGSQSSAETTRLREFLARNATPVAYFDIDVHPEAEKLLTQFGTGICGVCILRRVERAGAGCQGTWRPGWQQLKNRELFRLSYRHIRPGPGGARHFAGTQIRRRSCRAG